MDTLTHPVEGLTDAERQRLWTGAAEAVARLRQRQPRWNVPANRWTSLERTVALEQVGGSWSVFWAKASVAYGMHGPSDRQRTLVSNAYRRDERLLVALGCRARRV